MEIKGNIDEFGCPVLECSIANENNMIDAKVKACIDTGAYNYYLKQRFIDALKLPVIGETIINHPTHGKITSIKYYGSIVFEFGVYSNIIILPMVDDSYDYDFLIGTEFLKDRFFSYEGAARSWRISW